MQAVKRCMRCNAQNDPGQIYCVKCGKFLFSKAAGIPKNMTIWDMELSDQKKDTPMTKMINSSDCQQEYWVICPQCKSSSSAVNGTLPLTCDKCGYFFQAGIDSVVSGASSVQQVLDVKNVLQSDVRTVADEHEPSNVLCGRKNPLARVEKDTSNMRFIAISSKGVIPEEADEQGGIIGNNGTVMKWIQTSQQMSFRHTASGWYVYTLSGQPLHNGVPVNVGVQIKLSDGDILTIGKEQIRVEIV